MSRKNVFPLLIKWSFEQARSAHYYTKTGALIENSYSLVTHLILRTDVLPLPSRCTKMSRGASGGSVVGGHGSREHRYTTLSTRSHR